LFYAKCLPFYLARTIPKIIKLLRYLRKSKVVMQGKLIAVAYTLRTYWNQFSLGGICKQDVSVFVQYPRRLKALSFDNFDNSHNSFLLREYFIDYLCERWIPCQASTSVLCLHYRPVTVVRSLTPPQVQIWPQSVKLYCRFFRSKETINQSRYIISYVCTAVICLSVCLMSSQFKNFFDDLPQFSWSN